ASPFFNGNIEYFGDFFDHNGEPFFPLTYDKEKWKDAVDAIDDAIAACEANGISLYKYDKPVYIYDREDYAVNQENLQKIYDLRFTVTDPWNQELIWGFSNINYHDQGELAHSTNMRLPEGYGGGVVNTPEY